MKEDQLMNTVHVALYTLLADAEAETAADQTLRRFLGQEASTGACC
jgi:hypothetical protein